MAPWSDGGDRNVAPRGPRRPRGHRAGHGCHLRDPQGSGIVPPAGDDPGDRIIFVGREDAVVDGTGCGGTAGNVIQSVVMVDPFFGRSGRLSGVLVVSQTGPVQPGTKLKLPTRQTGDCTVNGVLYEKYIGQVE
jgi:hypothetical protein